MTRCLPILLAAFLVGCGGTGGLLATVPPPVEFASLPAGVAEVPKQGLHMGDATIEHVVLSKGSAGEYSESTTPIETMKVEIEIGEGGTVTLRRSGERESLFTGRLVAVTGSRSQTYADLEAFDGHKEKFPYAYYKDPLGILIVARTKIWKSGGDFEFDRYRMSFQW